MTKQSYYYNDPEIGSCPESSHPHFVAIVPGDYFYSCMDDFSPFGNDDGADALAMLEDWYRGPGQASGNVIGFLQGVISDWALGVPQNLGEISEDDMNAWLKKDRMHDGYLGSDCRLRIAIAFGQLKITGKIDDLMVKEAKIGLRWMAFLNAQSAKKYPDWEHADLEASRIAEMSDALAKYAGAD